MEKLLRLNVETIIHFLPLTLLYFPTPFGAAAAVVAMPWLT